jgi:hypothetical protein
MFQIGQNITVGPAAPAILDKFNSEVCRITAINGGTDTLTVTRQVEGSNSRSILAGDQVVQGNTPKVYTDIENVLNGVTAGATFASPVLTGASAVAQGTLGWDATNKSLLIGDGTVIESIDTSAWRTFNPVVTPGSGAFTTVSATMRYTVIGKTVFVAGQVVITAAGTASGVLNLTLPFNLKATNTYTGTGRATAISGKLLQVNGDQVSPGRIAIAVFDNTTAIQSGESLAYSYAFEMA